MSVALPYLFRCCSPDAQEGGYYRSETEVRDNHTGKLTYRFTLSPCLERISRMRVIVDCEGASSGYVLLNRRVFENLYPTAESLSCRCNDLIGVYGP